MVESQKANNTDSLKLTVSKESATYVSKDHDFVAKDERTEEVDRRNIPSSSPILFMRVRVLLQENIG